jgi:hypothetical protein
MNLFQGLGELFKMLVVFGTREEKTSLAVISEKATRASGHQCLLGEQVL